LAGRTAGFGDGRAFTQDGADGLIISTTLELTPASRSLPSLTPGVRCPAFGQAEVKISTTSVSQNKPSGGDTDDAT
jgi:hypothetical protein